MRFSSSKCVDMLLRPGRRLARHWGVYSAPQTPSRITGEGSWKGREGKGREKEGREGREGERRGGESDPLAKVWLRSTYLLVFIYALI